jgi:hypothetical protein
MGYNIRIGEAEPVIHWDDRNAFIQAADQDGQDLGAPLNSSGNYSNYCYPGYGPWHAFAYDTGLYSVFYAPRCPCTHTHWAFRNQPDCPSCEGGRKSVWWVPEGKDPGQGREGLICEQGAAKLTEDYYTAFVTAREAWLAKPEEERAYSIGEDGRDRALVRLDYLIFWTRWALDNCKYPTFSR